MPKPTLEEMAELCQGEADALRGHLTRYYADNPGAPPIAAWEHEAAAWEAAAQTFRVCGTYEGDFRRFIAEHVARWRHVR